MPVTTEAPLAGAWRLALAAPGGTVTVDVPCDWAITDDGQPPADTLGGGHRLQAGEDRDFALHGAERVYVRIAGSGTLTTTPAATPAPAEHAH